MYQVGGTQLILCLKLLNYHHVFQHLELNDSNYKHCPSNAKWDKVGKIKIFLKLFYDATLKFSRTKCPTATCTSHPFGIVASC